MTDPTTNNQLVAFHERYERLHEAKREIDSDLKDLLAELQSNGFDKKAFKTAAKRVKALAEKPEETQEQDALVDLYVDAISKPHARDAHARAA